MRSGIPTSLKTKKNNNKTINNNYQDMKGREEDDEHKTKTIKNQTRLQSSPMIGPAVPDRHGQVAVTRPKQYATYHEMERLLGRASDGEWSVLG